MPCQRPLLARSRQFRGAIFYIDAEVADRVFNLRMPEQYLDCPDVARGTVDHRSFRPTQRVSAIVSLAQADGSHPLVDQARILAGAHMAMMIDAARKEIVMRRTATPLQPADQGRTDIRRELELDGPVCFFVG